MQVNAVARAERAPGAPEQWRLSPADESWLNFVVQETFCSSPEAVSAVVKEHPQHEGVLLRGELELLKAGLGKAREKVERLLQQGEKALLCEDFGTANLLRRALLTRPSVLAADAVHFTEAVEESEYEPVAAHRIGQLQLCVGACGRKVALEAQLLVPAGEQALARHLKLPEGVALLRGQGAVELGLRARPATDGAPLLLATVELRWGSVFFDKHSKFRATAAVSYRPEVCLQQPYPRQAAEQLRAAGFSFAASTGVVGAKLFPVRAEFVQQLLPDAVLRPPRRIQLDFEPLAFASKRETLREALQPLLLEMDELGRAFAAAR